MTGNFPSYKKFLQMINKKTINREIGKILKYVFNRRRNLIEKSCKKISDSNQRDVT